MSAATDPDIPAATLILYQEDATGPARHLMIERTAAMAFAPGALVFPGGRLEPSDHALAADSKLAQNAPADVQDAAARIAAIRETIEEVGIAVAVHPSPDAALILAWRAALKSNMPLAALLQAAGAYLDLEDIIPFARWCPKLQLARRFDTRFYIAQAGRNITALHDPDEAAHHLWLTAQAALDEATAKNRRIIFPTLRNLERLALYPRFNQVLAHLAATPVRTISPYITESDGQSWLTIPQDSGYPITRALASENRG